MREGFNEKRIFVGKLPSEMNSANLEKTLADLGCSSEDYDIHFHDIPETNRANNFAFIGFRDQNIYEETFKKLKDREEFTKYKVEEARPRKGRTTKVVIKNLPPNLDLKTLRDLLSGYGDVTKVQANERQTEQHKAIVTFGSPENAEKCVKELDGQEFQEYGDNQLKCEYASGRRRFPSQVSARWFPVRLAVPRNFVGAIIGAGGDQIRQITKKSSARIDISKQPSFVPEYGPLTSILINGAKQECSEALRLILEIVDGITDDNIKQQLGACGGMFLVIPDAFCGRLIGHRGRTVTEIKNLSNSSIHVSNSNLGEVLNLRVVLITAGDISHLVDAERLIRDKLARFDSDDRARQTYTGTPGSHAYSNIRVGGGQNEYGDTVYGWPQGMTSPSRSSLSEVYTARLLVCNRFIGAIIGAHGNMIHNMIMSSGARIQVDAYNKDASTSADYRRTITITGTLEQQWRAQYFIFNKVKMELVQVPFPSAAGAAAAVASSGYNNWQQDVDPELDVLVAVPRYSLGWIIGRKGRTVRDIQQTTFAQLIIPRLEKSRQRPPPTETVDITIRGRFFYSLAAQARIRELVGYAARAEARENLSL